MNLRGIRDKFCQCVERKMKCPDCEKVEMTETRENCHYQECGQESVQGAFFDVGVAGEGLEEGSVSVKFCALFLQ